MIDFIIGKVKFIKEHSVTILASGIGLSFQTAQSQNFKEGETVELYTYFHWNSDNGPSLFAFQNELEKSIFLLIIDCHKIGPKIAMNILSQISPQDFLNAISKNDEKRLSSLSGIGPKKAEQIIMELKNKIAKLITTGKIKFEENSATSHFQTLNEALLSLGYSKQESLNALNFLRESESTQLSFDQLLRKSLGFLSKGA